MAISARHVRRGTITVHWVTTIASMAAPTVAEINAGTDLSGNIQGLSSFAVDRSTSSVGTVDSYGTTLTVAAPQRVVGTPTLTLYDEGTATAALHTTLALDTQGHVVFCLDGSPVASERAQVWPGVSLGIQHAVTGGAEAATMTCGFAIWALPTLNAVIA